MVVRRGRSYRRGWALPALLWAAVLAAGCLNPRPEEDPSYDSQPGEGDPTGRAGASAAPGPDMEPGSAAGAGGSGFGAGGSGAEPPSQSVDDLLDAGADASPDGAPNTAPASDAEAPDAGQL